MTNNENFNIVKLEYAKQSRNFVQSATYKGVKKRKIGIFMN